ncbi:MAG: efflux RND transporter periplasmic adaptor subunit [Hyphomicrobium sp.]|nr:MAG: efflux RND transporter periplasmic adaptor subunit [Hyphomicrobium sp.]
MSMTRRRQAASISKFPILLGTVALAGLLAGCKEEVPPQATVQPVQVMSVALAPAAPAWSYVGTIRPRYESDLGFRVGGKIVSRLVDVGDSVEPGRSLSKLDTTDFELSLEAQKSELSAARASLVEAKAALARYETLFQEGHVAQAALDQRNSAAAEAQSRVEKGERNVALAENQLSYAELKADHAGIISMIPVEVGQVVTAGQTVMRLARLDTLEVEADVPENMIGRVKSARAEAEIWGDGAKHIPATLREVSPEADATSRTYRVRFALPSDTTALSIGRTATIHLAGAGSGDVARLPLSAVSNDGKGSFVWVVAASGDRAEQKRVELAGFEQDRVLVNSGLLDGDRVVTLGVHMLDADKPIRIIEQKTALR